MNASTFSRLMDLSCLADDERGLLLDQTHPREVSLYLQALESIGRLQIPAPAASKMWAGRLQLLEAVDAYHANSTPAWHPSALRRHLPIPAAGLAVGTLLLASAAIGGSVAGLSGSGGTLSEVLSALGLPSAPETSKPSASPGVKSAIPIDTPENQIGVPGEVRNQESSPSFDIPDEPGVPPSETEEASVPGILPPQYPLIPPGQSGENPGQSGNPLGQSGENPGQAGNTLGQSGENPGQGGDQPGQSSEKSDEAQGQGSGQQR